MTHAFDIKRWETYVFRRKTIQANLFVQISSKCHKCNTVNNLYARFENQFCVMKLTKVAAKLAPTCPFALACADPEGRRGLDPP